ncbi:hypothetical protein NFI96_000918 [Prochilodus magdalenae]|nr:hypothetical protein NFI96_000918 [Prochilodus magdalenae]
MSGGQKSFLKKKLQVCESQKSCMPECLMGDSFSVMSPTFVSVEMITESVCGGTVVSSKMNNLLSRVAEGLVLLHLHSYSTISWVMFFDFSSAFNTIQPLLLRDKLMKMEVDMHLVTWITDYLTGRPQHVRIRDCSSDTVISSTGAPQGTVLSPVLFTLYTSDFKYNSELCHMQKFSDDTAIVGCVRNGQEREYRSLVEDFVEWCTTNHLKLNITKTKEMCIDFRRSRPS